MLRGRRSFLQWVAALLGSAASGRMTQAAGSSSSHFLAEAERMRKEAVASGDQSFGAVLVLNDAIAGYGPSRVIQDKNQDAHAERVAIWAAQKSLGRKDLSGAVLYSTSRPCSACEAVAAEANVARMIYGKGTDAGPPRRR